MLYLKYLMIAWLLANEKFYIRIPEIGIVAFMLLNILSLYKTALVKLSKETKILGKGILDCNLLVLIFHLLYKGE